MPVVPTYNASEKIDAARMPTAEISSADAQAYGSLGRAVQGVGGHLADLASHMQVRDNQRADTNDKLQLEYLDTDIRQRLADYERTARPDGAGFHDGALTKIDEIAQKRLSSLSGPNAETLKQSWGVTRAKWSNALAEQQSKISDAHFGGELDKTAAVNLNRVMTDPAGAEDFIQKQIDLERSSPLPSVVKEKRIEAWQERARLMQAGQVAKAMLPPAQQMAAISPASADQVWARMLVKENAAGDPGAVSSAGAVGLAQVMPDTARETAAALGRSDIAQMSDAQLRDHFKANPKDNLAIGRAYFDKMLQRYGGDTQAAAIAYNGGPVRADEWLKAGRDNSVLPDETRNYVETVASARAPLAPVKTGFGDVSFNGVSAQIGRAVIGPGSSVVDVARALVGKHEIRDNAAITAFLEKSLGKTIDPAKVPWCAFFADAVLGASGKAMLGSGKASDFLSYGNATNNPQAGDVVVFKPMARGSTGHLGIVTKIEGGRVHYIGGNDESKVNETSLPIAQVAGFRQPPDAGTPVRGIPGTMAGVDPRLSQLVSDPRFASLPADRLQAVVKDADTARAQATAKAEADRAAQYNAWYNDFKMGVLDGRNGMDDILAARKQGVLTDADHVKQLQGMVEARNKDHADINAFAQQIATPGFVWNQMDGDHKRQVDAGFKAMGGGVDALQGVVDKTGIVPSSAGVVLRGALSSTNAARTENALTVASNLMTRNPMIFDGVQNGAEIQDAAVKFRHWTETLGLSAKEAAARYVKEQTPEYQAELKKRIKSEDVTATLVKEHASGKLRTEVESAFNVGLPYFGRPSVEFSPEARQDAISTYAGMVEDNYMQTGDMALAKSQAMSQMKKVWNVSNVSGKGVVMKYPPERARAYQGIDNLSEAFAGQAVAEIKELSGADVAPASLRLSPISVMTKKAFESGVSVPYNLMWADKNGVIQTTGKAFVFDPAAARAAQTAERAKTFGGLRNSFPSQSDQGSAREAAFGEAFAAQAAARSSAPPVAGVGLGEPPSLLRDKPSMRP